MNKEKKKNYIEEMKGFFNKTSSVFITHYQGLSVKQIDELRKEMRKHGILFKITKNTVSLKKSIAISIFYLFLCNLNTEIQSISIDRPQQL